MNVEKRESGLLVPGGIKLGGFWHGQHLRNGRVIDEWEDHNLVVNEGLNSILNVQFANATQIPQWYIGVYKGNYTPVAGDTAANIVANSTEITTEYTGVRPTYNEASSSAQTMTNAANRASFVFTAPLTVYGAFLISVSNKSSTTGTLFSAAKFSTAKVVEATDELLLVYAFTAASV